MLKRWQSALALVALAGLVAATACKKTEPEGGLPADTTAAPAAPAPDTTMTSSAGSTAPNETKTFDVGAPSGTALALTATDKDASHSASGTVTLDSAAPAAWTIQ
jgi:hypothetical protein